jgi:hypothetical protein
MCTCGIDIATQQATPATHSSACAWFIEKPKGRSEGCADAPPRVTPATAAGGRARSASASTGMATALTMASIV